MDAQNTDARTQITGKWMAIALQRRGSWPESQCHMMTVARCLLKGSGDFYFFQRIFPTYFPEIVFQSWTMSLSF